MLLLALRHLIVDSLKPMTAILNLDHSSNTNDSRGFDRLDGGKETMVFRNDPKVVDIGELVFG